jgi:hypothetical protein
MHNKNDRANLFPHSHFASSGLVRGEVVGWRGNLALKPGNGSNSPFGVSMRRNDQPSRPSAMTCCFFSSLKTLLT